MRTAGPAGAAPVVVLHGFTGSASAMDPLVDRLVAPDPPLPALRVVAPDLVGHGASEAPDLLDHYRVDAMAAQVTALADALGWRTFHLVGYSMGGRVALTLGCTRPQRLRSLSVVGATPGIADAAERRRRAQADADRAGRITTDFAAFVDEWMADPLFAGQTALGEAHLTAARTQRLASDPAGLARSLLAGGTGSMEPLHDRLADCNVPALLVAGAQDAKFCAIADQLSNGLPRASVVHVTGAGHGAHLEQPDAAASAIAAFVVAAERHRGTHAGRE